MFYLDDIKNALTDVDKAIELNPSNINGLDKQPLLQYNAATHWQKKITPTY